MTHRGTDRKSRAKNSPAYCAGNMNDILAAFKLPESLPTSEINFPVLLKQRSPTNWNEIVKESDKMHQQLKDYKKSKIVKIKPPLFNTECDYILNEVLVHLIPALIETLNKAKLWKALERQKCFFNGIDHIAQLLWNNNPRYPTRKDNNLHLFNMPWVRKQLVKKPRDVYPKSWLWTEEHAAIVIQKSVRRYFVQKQASVQEMRDFWRRLKLEHQNPHIEMNPFLSKKFASLVLMSNRH